MLRLTHLLPPRQNGDIDVTLAFLYVLTAPPSLEVDKALIDTSYQEGDLVQVQARSTMLLPNSLSVIKLIAMPRGPLTNPSV